MRKLKTLTSVRPRILIADDDSLFARRLSEDLWDHGYETRVVRTVSAAKEAVRFWHPNTIFVNLLLPETNAISLMRFVQTQPRESRARVVVMSKQALTEAVDQVRRAGADTYLLKPFSLEDALAVVTASESTKTAHVRPTPVSMSPPVTTPFSPVKELRLLELFLRQIVSSDHVDQRLYRLMRMINMKVGGVRCSLIRCLNDDTAEVLASDDDENIVGLPLHLAQYPEIRAVREKGEPMIISNVRESAIMNSVQHQMARVRFDTLALYPVFRYGAFFGVLRLHLRQKDPVELSYIDKFSMVCSHILTLSINNPRHNMFLE